MPFDPEQPFELADSPTGFDPSQPFEEVAEFDPSQPFEEIPTDVNLSGRTYTPGSVEDEEARLIIGQGRRVPANAMERATQDYALYGAQPTGITDTDPVLFEPLLKFRREARPSDITRRAREFGLAVQVSPAAAQEELAGTPPASLERISEGVGRGVVQLAEGFTSPVGIATLGMGSLPMAAQRAVSLAFAAQMAKDFPEIARQLGDEFGKPTEQRDVAKIAELITVGSGTAAFTAMAAKHGLVPGDTPATTAARMLAENVRKADLGGLEQRTAEPIRLPIEPTAEQFLGTGTEVAAPPAPTESLPQPVEQPVAAKPIDSAVAAPQVPAALANAPAAPVPEEIPTATAVPEAATPVQPVKRRYPSTSTEALRRYASEPSISEDVRSAMLQEIANRESEAPAKGGDVTIQQQSAVPPASTPRVEPPALQTPEERFIAERSTPREGTPERTKFDAENHAAIEAADAAYKKSSDLVEQYSAAKYGSAKKQRLAEASEKAGDEYRKVKPAADAARERYQMAGIEDMAEQDIPIASEYARRIAEARRTRKTPENPSARLSNAERSRDRENIAYEIAKEQLQKAYQERGLTEAEAADEALNHLSSLSSYPLAEGPRLLDRLNRMAEVKIEDRARAEMVKEFEAVDTPVFGTERDRFKGRIESRYGSLEESRKALEEYKVWVAQNKARLAKEEAARAEKESEQIARNTSELQPTPKSRVTIADYGEERLEPGRLATDGRVMVDTQAVSPKELKVLQSRPRSAGAKPQEGGVKKLWDTTTKGAKVPLTRVGYRTTKQGAELAYYHDPKSGGIYPISRAYEALVQRWTGTTEARAGKAEQNAPVVFFKEGRPVAIVMPYAWGPETAITVETPKAVQITEPVGMGGAVPSEFVNQPQTPTGIKNATVDVERARRGLPPAIEPLKRSFGQVWDEAMAAIDNNPEAQDRLIAELRDKPRAITDLEDAMLLQRQVDLQNQYGKLTRDMAQAYEDSKAFPNRAAEVEELKLRTAALSDDLLDLYNINKSVGTETGRGLAARKMMANEDYTLATMELEKRSANGGAPLTEQQRAEIQKLHERIAATQKAFDDYQARVEDERAGRMSDEAIADMQAELKRRPNFDARIFKIAEEIVQKFEKQADAARLRLKERLGRVSAGVDPTLIYDLGVVGAAKIARAGLDFAKFSTDMVKEFGDQIKPLLQAAWERANLHIENEGAKYGDKAPQVRNLLRKQDAAGRRENVISGLQKAVKEGAPLELQGDYIRRLMESFIAGGITKREPLVDAIHKVLTDEVGMEVTRREVMEAMSGYGRFKALNPDKIKAMARDIRGQLQQVLKLEDIEARRPLRKTGVERRTASDIERRLIQQVNEAKRRFGVVVSDPARQLKSALDAIKTRVANQISDLEYQINTKQRTVKTRTPAPFDSETKLLELRRDELKAQFDEILPKAPMTDEQRAQVAQRALERSIADYERRIAAGDVGRSGARPGVSTPKLEALRARQAALRTEWQGLADAADPGRKDRLALSSLKTRLANRTAELQERLARGDFAPRQRRQITLDTEAQRLKAENERAKQDFQNGLVRDRLANRPWYIKAQDTFVKWRRGFLLSSPVTLAKLTSAAVQRFTITPIEEAAGAVIGKALPGLAARAPREGGFSVKAEAKALREGVMRGMQDAWDQLRRGAGRLDVIYGRGREGAIGEAQIDPSVIDFFGHLHGALKAPVKRAEFARSFEKRLAWNMRQGVDVSDPLVQMRIATEAYKDANRSIFLQDNRVVSAYKRALTAFEQPNKATGRVPVGGKIAATVARTLLPIVRVPTNIVAETFQYALGLPSGGARLGLALRRGIETLHPDEADLIMRHLKKGSLGAAVMLTGFLLPNVVGGYYQPGQKREPGDVKPGTMRVGGLNVPSYLLHNPLLETLQLGATIRRVADSKLRRRDPEEQGIPAGVMAGALGLTEEVPFVREQIEVAKAFDPRERGAFFGELTKSIAVPQLVDWIARQADQTEAGNVMPRKPETTLQHIEMGIPGLRQNVPINYPALRRHQQVTNNEPAVF
jgi:hypothetical protein